MVGVTMPPTKSKNVSTKSAEIIARVSIMACSKNAVESFASVESSFVYVSFSSIYASPSG